MTVPFALAPRRRRRQHDVGQLRRLGEEDVLHDEVVEALAAGGCACSLSASRLRRVLADARRRARSSPRSIASNICGQVPAVPRRDRARPTPLRSLARIVVVDDVLEAGQAVGDGAHVAAALHVVLAAQRVEAGAVAADVAGQQRQVDERQHVVDPVVVLGDAERPAQLGPVGAWRRRGPARGWPRRARRSRRSPRSSVHGSTEAAYSSKPVVPRSMKSRLCQPGVDDLAGRSCWRARCRCRRRGRASVGPLRRWRCGAGRRRTAGRRGARAFSTWWKKIGCVSRAFEPHRTMTSVSSTSWYERRAATGSEDCRQTDDAGSVSSAVAGVDVVRADRHADELLGDEVHLVGGLRAREHADRVRAVVSRAAAKPAAARPSASSQEAGRSSPFSRTSGWVSRCNGSKRCLTIFHHLPSCSTET